MAKKQQNKPKIGTLIQYIFASLVLIAAVEYFKYSTKVHYDWFHCTPVREEMEGSVIKLYAKGGPSCDKRGEFKTIIKRISRDFEPNDEAISFCIIENKDLKPVHYPLTEEKGEPGYYAYVGYDSDLEAIRTLCADAQIHHF